MIIHKKCIREICLLLLSFYVVDVHYIWASQNIVTSNRDQAFLAVRLYQMLDHHGIKHVKHDKSYSAQHVVPGAPPVQQAGVEIKKGFWSNLFSSKSKKTDSEKSEPESKSDQNKAKLVQEVLAVRQRKKLWRCCSVHYEGALLEKYSDGRENSISLSPYNAEVFFLELQIRERLNAQALARQHNALQSGLHFKTKRLW